MRGDQLDDFIFYGLQRKVREPCVLDNYEVIAVKLHDSILVCWGWEQEGMQ